LKYQKDGGVDRPGFDAVKIAPADGKVVGQLKSTVFYNVSKASPGCHGAHCPRHNVTEQQDHIELVELTEAKGVVPLMVLPSTMPFTVNGKQINRTINPSLEAGSVVRYGARFSAVIYTRGCHWFPRLLGLKRACGDQWHSSKGCTSLTGWHCKSRPNTEGTVLMMWLPALNRFLKYRTPLAVGYLLLFCFVVHVAHVHK
jgi:hypothetical protein